MENNRTHILLNLFDLDIGSWLKNMTLNNFKCAKITSYYIPKHLL